MSIFDKREMRVENISPYISIQSEVAPELCTEVKQGYKVFKLSNDGVYRTCPLSEALTIRTVEDVRREALEEAAEWAATFCWNRSREGMNSKGMKHPAVFTSHTWQNMKEGIISLIDTPAPSRETQPTPEPDAMRYGFDGYGFKYIDSGSGSDWQIRHPDAEPLFTVAMDFDYMKKWASWSDELRQAKAEAWDEGLQAGLYCIPSDFDEEINPNPYAAPDEGGE